MSVTLENDRLLIRVRDKGAELFSLVNKSNGYEYIWSGDPAFWGKTSPVLFPIVGALKENTFYYGTEKYTLPRHGFARDAVFETEKNTGTEATFLLRSNTEMLDCYPFPFELRLKYSLVEDVLSVTYEIANIGGDPMHFSVGGHPAFRVPLTSHTTYEDYYLRFPEDKVLLRWGLTPEGLIGTNTLAVELTDHKLALTRELFYTDALVMKHVKSKVVRLGSERHGHGLDFFREDFPYLGIWAAKNADFVCIEPWCGIADSAEHDQQLVSKEGIEHLLAGKKWSRNWRVKIF